MFDPLRQDVRFAFRTLLRKPWAAIATILLLGVGIGLNTTMFGLIDAYLLRSLPYPDADRLVTVRPISPGASPAVMEAIPDGLGELAWPARDAVIEETITWDLDAFTLTGTGRPEVVAGAWVPPGYLRGLRTRPVLGRLFTDEDGQPGAAKVIILGHTLWQRRYGGDPNVIGQTVSAHAADRPFESEVFTVVGVLPPDFWFINRYTEILANLTEPRMPYMLRLTPGATKEQAATHLTGIVRSQIDAIDAEWPGMYVESTHELHIERVRPVLIVLAVAAGFVLLISCGNVALLLTVRAFGRQREISVRRALGASRIRVAQQLAVEGLVLAGTACITGVVLASLTLKGFGPLIQEQLRTTVPGGTDAMGINLPALLVALLLSVITGLVFAIFPAMSTTKQGLARSMREGGPSSSDTRRRQIARNAVIASEVAVSLVLTVGAALMLRSAVGLHRVELGFEAANVLTANINLRQRSYPEDFQLTQFVDRYLDAVRATPNVESASIMAGWPFQDRRGGPVTAEGNSDAVGSRAVLYVVSDDYFETMSVPVYDGRGIATQDVADAESVVVVSETLARTLWPGSTPVGRRVRLGVEGPNAPWRTVIGVAADVRETLVGEVLPDTYIPFAQTPSPFLFVMAKVNGDPGTIVPAIQQAVWNIDPTGVATRIVTMSELVDNQISRPQFLAVLLTVFGVLAVSLALTGLYSIVAYAVSQRRRDVAIHMALGAKDQAVVNMFLLKAAMVIGTGTLLGLAGSAGLTRLLSSQLYGITSLDVTAYTVATGLMLIAALAAAWFPAHRATATDPMKVLRDD